MDVNKVRALLLQLREAISSGNRQQMNGLANQFIEQKAQLGEQWKAVTALLQRNGELNAANRAMAIYVKQHGNLAAARFDQAAVLAQTGHLAEAASIIASLPKSVPNPSGNAYIRSTMATNMGDVATARRCFMELLELNPLSGQGWLGLSMLGKMDSAVADQMLALRPRFASQPTSERAPYLYAVGRALEERQDFEASFDAISEGAELERQTRRYDPESDRKNAEAAFVGWSDHIASIPPGASNETKLRPIFVSGLPRSGTTLVEQILAGHSQVGGGGELGLLRILSQDTGGTTAQHFDDYLRDGGTTAELGALYTHLLGQHWTGNGFFVDKSLDTSRYLGLIAAVLPDAPIIWMRRDPLDCAWSAFRTYFLRGPAWSWSLTDIAHHFKLEDDLRERWLTQLGDRVLVVDYAELVANPEQHIKQIASHCGLPFETQMLSPETTKRPVTTASVAQVRQPINQSGIGGSEPYRAFLKPFIDVYYQD